jgi:hypothetical protein
LLHVTSLNGVLRRPVPNCQDIFLIFYYRLPTKNTTSYQEQKLAMQPFAIFKIHCYGFCIELNDFEIDQLFHFQINDAAAAATTPYPRQRGTGRRGVLYIR